MMDIVKLLGLPDAPFTNHELLDEAAAEIERLRIENAQLKGALGYSVPGDIPQGDFKCGLCEARDAEIERLTKQRDELLAALQEIATLTKAMAVVAETRIAEGQQPRQISGGRGG